MIDLDRFSVINSIVHMYADIENDSYYVEKDSIKMNEDTFSLVDMVSENTITLSKKSRISGIRLKMAAFPTIDECSNISEFASKHAEAIILNNDTIIKDVGTIKDMLGEEYIKCESAVKHAKTTSHLQSTDIISYNFAISRVFGLEEPIFSEDEINDKIDLQHAKDRWNQIIHIKAKEAITMLDNELSCAKNEADLEAVEEIELVKNMLMEAVNDRTELDKADSVTDVINFWPPILLPKPIMEDIEDLLENGLPV